MNILRLIKVKDALGEFENLTDIEKLFFELHDNLHEDFNGELCDENDLCIVDYDFKNGYFWYRYDKFYLVFRQKFDINSRDFNYLCKDILKRYLNCSQLTPYLFYKTH